MTHIIETDPVPFEHNHFAKLMLQQRGLPESRDDLIDLIDSTITTYQFICDNVDMEALSRAASEYDTTLGMDAVAATKLRYGCIVQALANGLTIEQAARFFMRPISEIVRELRFGQLEGERLEALLECSRIMADGDDIESFGGLADKLGLMRQTVRTLARHHGVQSKAKTRKADGGGYKNTARVRERVLELERQLGPKHKLVFETVQDELPVEARSLTYHAVVRMARDAKRRGEL